jgi:hypothetical protein
MSECVAGRAAAIGSLILPAVAAAHQPGRGGKAGSGPINIISTEGKIAAAVRSEFIRLGQLDDAALLASAEHGRHATCSIESISLSPAYDNTNDFTVAIRIPHMRRCDLRKAAEVHRGRLRPDADLLAGDTRPANGSRTAVARRCA